MSIIDQSLVSELLDLMESETKISTSLKGISERKNEIRNQLRIAMADESIKSYDAGVAKLTRRVTPRTQIVDVDLLKSTLDSLGLLESVLTTSFDTTKAIKVAKEQNLDSLLETIESETLVVVVASS